MWYTHTLTFKIDWAWEDISANKVLSIQARQSQSVPCGLSMVVCVAVSELGRKRQADLKACWSPACLTWHVPDPGKSLGSIKRTEERHLMSHICTQRCISTYTHLYDSIGQLLAALYRLNKFSTAHRRIASSCNMLLLEAIFLMPSVIWERQGT